MEQKRMAKFLISKDMLGNFSGKGVVVVPLGKG